MTLRRSQRSAEDILYDLCSAYPGGMEAIAQRVDINVKVLYKKLSSSVTDRALTTHEFRSIVMKLEEASIDCSDVIQAFLFPLNRIAINLGAIDETTDEDLRKNGMLALRELGDFSGELEEALERGEIGDHEMEMLEPKKRKLLATMHTWWGKIKARHAARKERRAFFASKASAKEAATLAD